jgi:hypothetical protein
LPLKGQKFLYARPPNVSAGNLRRPRTQPTRAISYAARAIEKLKEILSQRQQDLPRELHKFESIEAQAQHLLDTSCELDIEPGQYLHWYAVRLEK